MSSAPIACSDVAPTASAARLSTGGQVGAAGSSVMGAGDVFIGVASIRLGMRAAGSHAYGVRRPQAEALRLIPVVRYPAALRAVALAPRLAVALQATAHLALPLSIPNGS